MKTTNREIRIVGCDLVITNILSPKEQNVTALTEVLKQVEIVLRSSGFAGFDQDLKQQFEGIVSELVADPTAKVSDIAAKLNLSVSTLGRWCYRTYGVSPMKYLYHLRLSKAAALLAQNYGRVKEVAYETGFNSLSYFSNATRINLAFRPPKHMTKDCNFLNEYFNHQNRWTFTFDTSLGNDYWDNGRGLGISLHLVFSLTGFPVPGLLIVGAGFFLAPMPDAGQRYPVTVPV